MVAMYCKNNKGFDDFVLVLLFQSVSPLLVETVPRLSTSSKSYE